MIGQPITALLKVRLENSLQMITIYTFRYIHIITKDNKINNSLGCKTNGGAKPNTLCVFPFKFKGVMYTACTNVEADYYWCSTQVDGNGTHTRGNWGKCNNECPNGKDIYPELFM